MTDKAGLRASDADRERVAGELAEHMAAGRLELDEFDERLTRVYATRMQDDLAALTEDLPRPRPPAPAMRKPRRGLRAPFGRSFKVTADLDRSREEIYDWALANLAPNMGSDKYKLVEAERPHRLRFVLRRPPHWAPIVAIATWGIGLVAFLIRVEEQVNVVLMDGPEGGTRLVAYGEAPGWVRERFERLR